MNLPSWDPSFETGDPAIDAQHRELLDLVDEMGEADLDERKSFRLLGEVMDFTLSHFDFEEALMDRVGYPQIDRAEMTEEHREFVDYARLRVLEFRSGEFRDVQPFVSFLRDWLTQHEFGLDRKLVAFIKRTAQSATAHAPRGG